MVRDSSKINVLNLIVAIIMWLIVSAWTIVIFTLTSESAYVSYSRSLSVSTSLKSLGLEFSQVFIRKAAIVIQYGVLSLAVYLGMVYTNGISERLSFAASPIKLVKHSNELCILYSLWITIFVSSLNEYFQLFVEGRDATVVDIGIAAGSAVIVLLVCRIAFLIHLRILNREEIDYE